MLYMYCQIWGSAEKETLSPHRVLFHLMKGPEAFAAKTLY